MPEPHVYRPYQSTSGPHDGHTITFANIELWQDELPDALDIGGHLWVRERTCTMELWSEWEQVLFANVTDEVAQDNLNECVHELLDKAATVGAGEGGRDEWRSVALGLFEALEKADLGTAQRWICDNELLRQELAYGAKVVDE